MKWIKAIVVAAAVLAAAGGAQAAGMGVRAGTTGIGGDVGFSLMPTLSARLGYSGLSYSRDIDVTDVEYDGRLRLSNLNLLLDFSPLPGPFRIALQVDEYECHSSDHRSRGIFIVMVEKTSDQIENLAPVP
jgi:hypothetical protein